MFLLAKYGVQTAITFPIVKRGVVDLAATADWTPATGDTKVSKDGGNFANTTNNPAAVGGTGSIGWTLTLTATELTAAVVDVQIVDSATKAVEDQYIKVYTYGNASAKIPLDLSINQTGDSFARLGAPVGASISADVAGVQSDTDNIQTRLPAALVSGRMDSSVGAMAADTLTAAALAADAVTEIQAGLATSAALATVDTVVDAIQAKTDNLPLDPADASDIAAAFSTVNSTLGTIASYVDTEVAAIKAKTDNLPASPAATSDIPTSDITAIKAKTDSLTFTVAGRVDSNITHVIGAQIQENGASDTNWGGPP